MPDDRQAKIKDAYERAKIAADAVFHGVAQGLINDGYCTHEEAGALVAHAMVKELEDHGFIVYRDDKGGFYIEVE